MYTFIKIYSKSNIYSIYKRNWFLSDKRDKRLYEILQTYFSKHLNSFLSCLELRVY